ncbi:acyl-CoA dehydratase activase [Acetobacterium wieringae]|uniref:acyl-CoA dehydratase activase n=1 Tax=Acetobacterium wieringae TaxID=52694 RepID=UPI002B1EEB2B|nr:acyl-CoA dehydratase activase [Acetobacterium wieringae]MEA4807268.1 acyl-CoA dehydratase activase [Acetobacterium wieringae]
MIFAGVDVGSLSAEAVLVKDNEILAHSMITVKPNPVTSATLVMDEVLKQTGLNMEDISCCVSTGYGRERIPFAQYDVSEISCHGKGAHWANNEVRSIIDVGGQDSKLILIDENGDLDDFMMNDKCAAGTGRFLEGIAKTFGIHVSELGDLALKGQEAIPISSICTVYTQFDVMGLLADGRTKEDIALGVSESLATRLNKMVVQLGLRDKLCCTGGVAKNKSVVECIEKVTKKEVVSLGDTDPQIIGALGAALYAGEMHLKQLQKEAKLEEIM